MKYHHFGIITLLNLTLLKRSVTVATEAIGRVNDERTNKSKGLRGSSGDKNTHNVEEKLNDSSLLRDLSGLFEGDIIPDYDSILANYGPDVVEKLIEDGILDPPPSDDYPVQQNIVTTRRWSDRYNDIVEVPYVIDQSEFTSSQIQKINDSIKELAERSGVVKFVPRNGQEGYLYVMRGSGCSSFVGPFGGKQDISLAGYCASSKGVIQHEFMHALGLYHEQSRPDRDSYVKINYENVQGGTSNNNFAKKTSTSSLGGEYDYGSVMHYPKNAFSTNGRDTITPIRPTNGANIGQRSGADEQDIIDIRLLYQCISGPRTMTEYNSDRCTTDCKCWKNEIGCSGNNNACQGSLTCSNNRCVDGNGAPTPPTRPSPPTPTRPSPTPPTGGRCQDSPLNWHDDDGERFNCEWYAENDYCERFGDKYFNFGKNANQACCACGGGTTSNPAPAPSPTMPTPTRPTPPPPTPTRPRPTPPTPTRPRPTPTPPTPTPPTGGRCQDSPLNWHDDDGERFNCDWYAENDYCERFGDKYFNFGKNANQACCACGGGTTSIVAPVPAPTPPTPRECQNSPLNWHDLDGPRFNCEWYAENDYCERFGDKYLNFGKTANQACCACGGGTN